MNTLCPPRDGEILYKNSSDDGFSNESQTLRKLINQEIEDRTKSISFGQHIEEAIKAFEEILEENYQNNWDGYEGKPVSYNSLIQAYLFIKWMPYNFPKPDILIKPTGEIAFEWYQGPKSLLLISFSGEDSLHFAGRFGLERIHGKVYFSDNIPETILHYISKAS